MKDRVRIDYSALLPFVSEEDLSSREAETMEALRVLESGEGAGAEYRGWISYPENVPREEIRSLSEIAREVRDQAEVLIVIGIGGSYLGARAVIEALTHGFSPLLPEGRRGGPLVLFAGQNLSGGYLEELLEAVSGKSLYVNMISKSGTTTEPGLAFRLFRKHLVDRYGGKEAARRIVATTDARKGALRKLTDAEGYRSFVIPDDIGGRFSVLTPVGLFPIAVSGVEIDALLQGAQSMMAPCSLPRIAENPAALYACARHLMWTRGKAIEILVSYEPKLQLFAEWWKQLFGESEGKEGQGILPFSALFTTDLHSLGQWIQEGPRTVFETVIRVEKEAGRLSVPTEASGLDDGLGYLEGRSWSAVQEMAYQGTKLAHHRGGVPVMVLEVPSLDAGTLGQMIYLFEKACGISGYLSGVNPFNQPGVEEYKNHMFALLGKPGFEKQTAAMEETRKRFPQGKIV
jgi:glucose-6-phosphate isomerase